MSELGNTLGVLGVPDLGHQQVLPQLPLQLRELPLGLSDIIIESQSKRDNFITGMKFWMLPI